MVFLLVARPGSTAQRKSADVRSSSGLWTSDWDEGAALHRKDVGWVFGVLPEASLYLARSNVTLS